MAASRAQEFKLLDRNVQVHGFFSQGFIYTSDNNWLTMNTSHGSAAMTDMALNLSTQINDKIRIGAQVYDRNLGQLGQWHPSLDWGLADYRFKNWLGIRAGKVKTTLGLYTDTQDLDFLHPFALLPQSVYPTDLRDTTIAHTGVDFYGNKSLPRVWGGLAYTGYVGHRSDSIYSGYPYLVTALGVHLHSLGGLQYGADLRWMTPVKGLLVGASRMNEQLTGKGSFISLFNPTAGLVPYQVSTRSDWVNQYYGQYALGRLQVDAEYRRYFRDEPYTSNSEALNDVRGWYVSGSYRVCKRFQLGTYYSHYSMSSFEGGELAAIVPNQTDTSLPQNHVYDKAVAARFYLNRFWILTLSGHFMNGYGNGSYPDGFYPQTNPQGFKPDTNALVMRTTVHF